MNTVGAFKTLEKEYARFTGNRFAVACNSGTSALHLALLAMQIGWGDEVIVPDFTMAACGFAVHYTGAKPVFVDCKDDLTIDEKLIEAKITPKTKVIMAVHTYGRLANMKALRKICDKHRLKLIEDACEAQGAVYESLADITCYSFYKNKIIHAEEGGILTTNNQAYAEIADYYKNMAFDTYHTYFHSSVGYNYRIPDSQAILALKSLKDYEKNNRKRRKVEAWFQEIIPTQKRDAVWVYDFYHPQKDEMVKKITEARHFFKPLSTFPMWIQEVGKKAEHYSKIGMYFPVTPEMTEKDVINLCKQLV